MEVVIDKFVILCIGNVKYLKKKIKYGKFYDEIIFVVKEIGVKILWYYWLGC